MTKLDYKGVEIFQTPEEIKTIRELVRQITDVPGDLAEVGVYQGASALIIREENQTKPLYLFDTFEGFAHELHENDPISYQPGDCAADIKHVTELLKDQPGVTITKGIFPWTAKAIEDKVFAFVHIDVDIYLATKNALKFFLPRMSPGGVILVHDYPAHSGVRQAVDDLDLENKVVKGGRQLAIFI